MEALFIAIGILAWLFDLVKKARKASRARANASNPPLNPIQQALADAPQRQTRSLAPQQAPPRGLPRFGQPSGSVPPSVPPPFLMPRQPSAGGPAVPREATSADFVSQEQALLAEEAAGLGVPLDAPIAAPKAAAPLFGNVDDLVRAIILQEVLGPPLSRRGSPAPPPA